MMRPFRLVIFDLAGTTIDDRGVVADCLRKAVEAVGLNPSAADIKAVRGLKKPEAIRLLLRQGNVQADAQAVYLHFLDLIQDYYRNSSSVHEIPGTSQTMRELRSIGLRIALDTGFERVTADLLRERMPWEGLVDATVTSDEVPRGRPYPDMILELARRLQVPLSQVVKVGDTPNDLLSGSAAGVGLNIGVLTGSGSYEELRQAPYDLILPSVADIPNSLRECA